MVQYRTLQLLSILAVVGYGGDSDLFLKQVCFVLSVNCNYISSAEVTGAKLVLSMGDWTLGRRGGTKTCFYHVSVNFDRTYCFFWQKFCWWSSSLLRIEKSNKKLLLSLEMVLPE